MKFGVREICDVVLKAKSAQTIGKKRFFANEPVIYFDTLKTSSMEGAATTVYAQGGRGNSRLVAWEGERTVTFTMEDALISPEGFMILSGAGLVDATEGTPVYQHVTETVDGSKVTVGSGTDAAKVSVPLSQVAYLPKGAANKLGEIYVYVMFMKNGEIVSEPYIATNVIASADNKTSTIEIDDATQALEALFGKHAHEYDAVLPTTAVFDAVLVDYYVEHKSGAQQIEITADKFGGNYYLEASTLFRDQNGVDMPAEFIIPNCKIQSNFTFTMASSGDPSTFTFTMDAFPDYTRFDRTKKVIAAIQIIKGAENDANDHRLTSVFA